MADYSLVRPLPQQDVPLPNVGNALLRASALKDYQRRERLADLAEEKYRTEQGERQQFNALVGGTGGKITDDTVTRAYGIKPEFGNQLRTYLQNARKEERDAFKARNDQMGSLLGAVLAEPPENRPSAFQWARQEAQRLGHPLDGVPEQYDERTEGWVRFKANQARQADDIFKEIAEGKKAPTVHRFVQGNEDVDKTWNPQTRTWDVHSRGPRWQEGSGSKAPTTRTRNVGDETVTEEWSPQTGWNEVSRAPRWQAPKPTAPTTRSVQRGDEVVTEEWSADSGWREVSRAPRWQAPKASAPTSRTVQRGDETVTEEWTADSGWKEVSRAPRWQDRDPKAPSTRTIYRGDKAVQQEWTGNGWVDVGEGDRFNARTGAPTQAQQASNIEIKAARDALRAKYPGLTPEQLKERTTPTTATGRENKLYDPNLERLARSASQRMVGDDPEFEDFFSQIYVGPRYQSGGALQPQPASDPLTPGGAWGGDDESEASGRVSLNALARPSGIQLGSGTAPSSMPPGTGPSEPQRRRSAIQGIGPQPDDMPHPARAAPTQPEQLPLMRDGTGNPVKDPATGKAQLDTARLRVGQVYRIADSLWRWNGRNFEEAQ